MTEKPTIWRNRIVDRGERDPRELAEHPSNWRVHSHAQRQKMQSVLSEIGWVQGVLVNKNTNTILDGHMRVAIAIQQSEPIVPVTYVDMTVDEENIVLATLDPIKSIAATDDEGFDNLRQALAERNPGLAALTGWMRATRPEDMESVATGIYDDYSPNYGVIGQSDRGELVHDHTKAFSEDDGYEPEEGVEDFGEAGFEEFDEDSYQSPYAGNAVRQIRFLMDADQYAVALGVLEHITQNEGIDNHTKAVLWLLKEFSHEA